jgi:hypothetical protein
MRIGTQAADRSQFQIAVSFSDTSTSAMELHAFVLFGF